ncbi:hypothetical protein fugu_006308 [Takifugu bimaculatus]|uniref:PDZK1-interacting protein 1 n=1 Tax=Takifugu bimaculatus TaxID=433685 RepID=A0A4Z2B7L4_9TELE|nr:hypothetical protein fugu_006308 [Takifugu bimaculatus]
MITNKELNINTGVYDSPENTCGLNQPQRRLTSPVVWILQRIHHEEPGRDLLFAADGCGRRSQAERALPQWLTGIIAVAGFLLLAFVALLVNRAWCGKSSYKDVESDERRSEATYDTSLNTLSSKGIDNAYANVAFSADEKVTAM